MFLKSLLYIKNIIIYFSIIQSFLLALHFFTNKHLNSLPNKILAWLLFFFGLSVLAGQLFVDPNFEFSYNSKWLVHIRIQINLFLMVLFYLHVKAILVKDFVLFRKFNIVFLLPVILSTVYFKIKLAATPWPAPFFSPVFIQISIVNFFNNLLCFSLIFYLLKNHFKTAANYFSDSINPNVKWLNYIIGTFLFLWTSEIALLFIIHSAYFLKIFPFLIFIYTIVPFIFMNTILVFVMKSPKIFVYKRMNMGITPKKNPAHLMDRLHHLLISEKIYTDPELSLAKVAERLQINPKYLSAEINENLNQSFADLINSYRINESKKLLIEIPDKTIQEIMYEVGFNSKSAFNTHFKQDTGLTPKEFRQRNQLK